ncbi:MAG: NAD(P)/FAD-dependent oxidoreductase [Candidatus Stahlbacteria bacterium]|nr:NAD(P)/FAD-dependent oxidoreductase [Candidatus Stahlbacteria bacterium]
MERVDTTIIGAGVVGLSIAAQIAQPSKEVYIIERHASFGQETSSRNSEVIHSGIYYPKGSLKAITCVEGNRLLYDICASNNIPHKRIGKLIIATNLNETQILMSLLHRATDNGVQDLVILNKKEMQKIEPNIEGVAALYSPNTGIIDSHSLMLYFANKSKANGATFIYGATVIGIDSFHKEYKITIIDTDKESFSFISRVVINAAGLEADTIAKLVGINTYNLLYCKGDYFKVGNHKNKLINHLIYPVPHSQNVEAKQKSRYGGAVLGIHATINLQNELRLGPDDYYIPRSQLQGRLKPSLQQDYSVDASKSVIFYHAVKPFLPFIEIQDLTPEQSGIRPKLQPLSQGRRGPSLQPDFDFTDFIIQDETQNGLHNFINLIGIESPGLTASPAIANLVAHLLSNFN